MPDCPKSVPDQLTVNEVLPTVAGDEVDEDGGVTSIQYAPRSTDVVLQLPAKSRVRMWKYLLAPLDSGALVALLLNVSTIVSGSVLDEVSKTYE